MREIEARERRRSFVTIVTDAKRQEGEDREPEDAAMRFPFFWRKAKPVETFPPAYSDSFQMRHAGVDRAERAPLLSRLSPYMQERMRKQLAEAFAAERERLLLSNDQGDGRL